MGGEARPRAVGSDDVTRQGASDANLGPPRNFPPLFFIARNLNAFLMLRDDTRRTSPPSGPRPSRRPLPIIFQLETSLRFNKFPKIAAHAAAAARTGAVSIWRFSIKQVRSGHGDTGKRLNRGRAARARGPAADLPAICIVFSAKRIAVFIRRCPAR
ncbi:hypothetical protein EVAR_52171_1 [Eumeta japonica]|uniref:Uncharacterized protein n=1 Tax=Eumeta variegata TaxID=151549 RepID=A0A4C1YBI1_EUMVA|nr:hypothetical protein EVAR_52171_1 [Eumeta japonica]